MLADEAPPGTGHLVCPEFSGQTANVPVVGKLESGPGAELTCPYRSRRNYNNE